MMRKEWTGFEEGNWTKQVDVRNFIQKNYIPYKGDASFLQNPTSKTVIVWEKCEELLKEELQKGILGVDLHHISGVDNFKAGYIDKENEIILGLQTDEPLKRMINPFGGSRSFR